MQPEPAAPASPASRPTLADVAAKAGVSASTASLAFSGSGPVSDATKQRVLDAAAALGYGGPDPRARSLRRGRSGIVGVVLEERVRAAFLDPVKIQMLDGITEGIAPLGAGLLLLTDTGEPGENAVNIESAPVDAVVLIGCSPRLAVSIEALRRRGIPAVAIEGDTGEDLPEISIDNHQATRRGAEYLRELGHTEVALVTLPFDAARTRGPLTPELERTGTAATARERLAGAREVFPGIGGQVAGASSIEEGLEAARALLADPETRPTAVIAQSDLLAAGVIRAAEELGIAVPAELSVIGFDGIRVDGLQHDLTTLSQPSVAKGRAAGEAVVGLLAGESPKSVCFTSTLHVGDTTAPPPAR
ncbi:LacI family DNA-binding transcriptional regulator [Agromyces endophyticus]|uniref:LacI family DNA-binding transcriptional regulator n=1 Tax=Agromyces sp. H17E-10 TaxID=2932244 RepID=UPI001FD2D672|nr:LacI family DNA-binding transcriptional regulator [Agromyces sp. H17E-10]UOQ90883.1 LacI family DNA-binding transcriptional regulator [Agromyces sp. H17E-10]